MASKFNASRMKVVVRRENVDPNKWANDINIMANTGMRKLAESLRDEMREAYLDSIGHTDYGKYGSGIHELEKFIVVSPKYSPIGVYSVGAKNQTYNGMLVEELFMLMDEGTGQYNGGKDYWRFELPQGSLNAGEVWATTGQEAKEFISGPAKYYTNTFERQSDFILNPMIYRYTSTGGRIKV